VLEMEDVLQLLKGRLVKILYMNADEPRVIRGKIKAFDSEMLILETLNNEFYIRRSCISTATVTPARARIKPSRPR